MNNLNLKFYKPRLLISVILALAALISTGLNYASDFFEQWHIRTPSTIALLGGVFVLYDRYGWRRPVFKYLVNLPDMNGRYKGVIKYQWGVGKQREDREMDCYIEIRQTASKISICSYFNNKGKDTSSRSIIEDIRKEADGHYYIYFFYENSGDKYNGSLDSHEGANKLKFLPGNTKAENKLSGHYFTNRQKQTRGQILVKFDSEKLKGEF